MNYIQKNKKSIILAVIALLLAAALLVLWLQRKVLHSADDIIAAVYPSTLHVGDSLSFENKSNFGTTVRWDFGDGVTTDKSSGVHFFKKSGFYPVSLTLDNKYTKTFSVLVSAPVARATDTIMTTSVIDGPPQAMQLENVFFRAISPDASSFSWRFGESGNIDSNEKMPSYAYKNPGNYTVILTTDVDQVSHQIKILPAYSELDDVEEVMASPSISAVFEKISNDFKYHLQQIANGNNFNTHYNYLLNTYLCNKDNISVNVNGNNQSFYYYTTGLQFDKKNIIQEAKITFDADQNCVTNVEIKQSK